MPKKAADKKFQIQNNLAPVFVIDWNRFKQGSRRAKTVIQTANETIGNGDKRKRTWSVHTNKVYRYLTTCVACALDNMFSGFNTEHKAPWLMWKS